MGGMLLELVIWLQILTAVVKYSSVSGLDITLSNREGFDRAPSCRHSVARIEITNTVRSFLAFFPLWISHVLMEKSAAAQLESFCF